MDTYHNAYQILYDVRENVNEGGTAYVEASDTSGLYSNSFLMQRINESQKFIYASLMKYKPDHFLKSASVSVVSSVITLPWDYGATVMLKDENGFKVSRSSVAVLPTVGAEGSDKLYYHKGNTLVLNKANHTATYTLWYWTKPRELHHGQTTAGGALSMTLAADAKLIDDY